MTKFYSVFSFVIVLMAGAESYAASCPAPSGAFNNPGFQVVGNYHAEIAAQRASLSPEMTCFDISYPMPCAGDGFGADGVYWRHAESGGSCYSMYAAAPKQAQPAGPEASCVAPEGAIHASGFLAAHNASAAQAARNRNFDPNQTCYDISYAPGCAADGGAWYHSEANGQCYSMYRRGLSKVSTQPARQRVLPAALGTSHAKPRYNPFGQLQTAFIDGARDAYNLGFQTLKIWNGHEVRDSSFYFLSQEDRNRLVDFSSALDIQAYQDVLAIPFQTVVFESDDPYFRSPSMYERRFTDDDRNRIYRQVYEFAARLRRQFANSGRTFIIQNHEGEWHLTPNVGSQTTSGDPNEIAISNMTDYLSLRQAAVENARRDVPSNANVYHLCEVVRLWPSIERGAPSIAQDILPRVACDLVGYSSYESLDGQTDSARFDAALAYLRSRSLPSPTFGTNQVVVSEIGMPERRTSAPQQENIARVMKSLIDRGMPYVLFWNLYDNECTFDCRFEGSVTANLPEEQVLGFYVRKPNGQLGHIFSTLLAFIDGRPTGPAPFVIEANRAERIHQCYWENLGRAPDQEGFNYWMVQPHDFGALCNDHIRNSKEGKLRRCYIDHLGRVPDAAGMAYWLASPVEAEVICERDLRNSPEAAIRQCYLRNLGREPDRAGMEFWLAAYQNRVATLDHICSQIR